MSATQDLKQQLESITEEESQLLTKTTLQKSNSGQSNELHILSLKSSYSLRIDTKNSIKSQTSKHSIKKT
mgnify:CR=1 FL=1